MFEKQTWMQRAGEYPQSDQEYFGLLARAVFSAGLGPKVVESRWKDITEAFHGFDPAKVKEMGEADVDRLLGDKAVIRNRRKIEAVIEQRRDLPGAGRRTAVVPRLPRRSGRRRRPGRGRRGAHQDLHPSGTHLGAVLSLQRRLAPAGASGLGRRQKPGAPRRSPGRGRCAGDLWVCQTGQTVRQIGARGSDLLPAALGGVVFTDAKGGSMDPVLLREYEAKLGDWLAQGYRLLADDVDGELRLTVHYVSREGEVGQRARTGVLALDPRDRAPAERQRRRDIPGAGRPAAVGGVASGGPLAFGRRREARA